MRDIIFAEDDVPYSSLILRDKCIQSYRYFGVQRDSIRNLVFERCNLMRIFIDTEEQITDCRLIYSNMYDSKFNSMMFVNCKFENSTFDAVDFTNCVFQDCIFENCVFSRCNFQDSKLYDELFIECRFDTYNSYIKPMCPEKGSYIAYKKAYIDRKEEGENLRDWSYCYPFSFQYIPVIVELKITEDAKRSSATSNKCRASKCEVLSIKDCYKDIYFEKAHSTFDSDFIYEVGKTIEVENFDENRWNECSTGIHHFLNREDAVNYY